MSRAMDISATEDTVDSVLSRRYRLEVPDYQRRYDWGKQQWREFWSDLTNLSESNSSHFLGSVVVIKHSGKLDELDVLELVDGQQRLVTISLILCLMRERFSQEPSLEVHAESINNEYLWVRDADAVRYPKITLNRFDDDDYRTVLNGRMIRSGDSQLKEACEWFAENIRETDINKLNELRKRLLNSMSLVTIECDSELSAFKLFETLNDRGLSLSAVDLMKNHLLQTAHESPNVDAEIIKEQWDYIQENVIVQLDKPEQFFRHYIMSAPAPDVNDGISNRTLYDAFRRVLNAELESTDLSIEEYISDMADMAPLYMDIVNADIEESDFSLRAQGFINRKLRDLNAIGNTQTRTFLLRLFREFDSSIDIMKALRMLEVMTFRRSISSLPTGGELDRLYSSLCSNVFDASEPIPYLKSLLSDHTPSDNVFRTRFVELSLQRQKSRTKYMLDTFERGHFARGESGKEIADRSVVEIEHIAPENSFSANKWSPWRDYLNVNEEVFNNNRHRLGNLTLLNERANKRASDNPFEQKKEYYRDSAFKMTQAICEYDEWSIEKIDQRSNTMADIAVDLWNLDTV